MPVCGNAYLKIMINIVKHQLHHVAAKYAPFNQYLNNGRLLSLICEKIVDTYKQLCQNSLDIPLLTYMAYQKIESKLMDVDVDRNAFKFFCQSIYRNHFWLHGTILEQLSDMPSQSDKEDSPVMQAHMCPCNHSDMFWCRNLIVGKYFGKINMKNSSGRNTLNEVRKRKLINYFKVHGKGCQDVFFSHEEFKNHLVSQSNHCVFHEYLMLLLQMIRKEIKSISSNMVAK